MDDLNRDELDATTSAFSKSIMGDLTAVPPRNPVLLLGTVFLGRGSGGGGSFWLFPPYSPQSTGQSTHMGILPVAKDVYSN